MTEHSAQRAIEYKSAQLVPYYEKGGITLYNAKYEDVLHTINQNSFDALITDPPYANTDIEWDKAIGWNFFWQQTQIICKPKSPMVLFASGKFVNKLINTNSKHYRYELIWEKNLAVGFLSANQRPLRAHENILIFTNHLFHGSTYNPQMIEGKMHTLGKDKPFKIAHYAGEKQGLPKKQTNLYHPRSILRFNNSRSKSLHPTQKPLDLMKWLVRTYTNRGDKIFEPFAGSGSTIIAAMQLGRQCLGIEQSEAYCEIIANRLEKGE